MKVISSNQTLILASERRAAGDPRLTPARLVNAAASAPGLSRVTIVAAQPDTSVLYFRADYAAREDRQAATPEDWRAAPASGALPWPAANVADVSGAPAHPGAAVRQRGGASVHGGAQDGSLSAYLHPADQYARTQRLGLDEAPPRLDVHA